MEMYKLASQMKVRFQSTKGDLSTEQLWELSLDDLDKLTVALDADVNQSEKKSYLRRATKKSELAKLKFDIALDVLNTRLEEANALTLAREEKERKDKIQAIIARKKEGQLEEMSVEELEALL